MIYIKNTKEIQTIFIPRTELEKDSYVVSVKGYDKGVEDGKELQKSKLTNLHVTNNGVYKREDGWNEVEVDVESGALIKTQEKTVTITKDIETILPDDGYDAFTKVDVDATEYGKVKRDEGYNQGNTDGITTQKSKLTNLSVTSNGMYEREDGWNIVEVNVPSNTLRVHQKNIVLTQDIETVLPSEGYDALSRVDIDATYYVKTKYDEGYNDGYQDGIEDCGGGTTGDVAKDKMKFAYSQFTKLPNYNFSGVTDFSYMFAFCDEVVNASYIDTSSATTMYSMFNTCDKLESIAHYDTSNVTDMEQMFIGCSNLKTIPQLNTSKVRTMDSMFGNCSSLTTIPLLDTSNVTDMSYMFDNCYNLITIPQIDTSNVTDMSTMFNDCINLTSIPALNASKVTNIFNFFGDNELTKLTDFGGLIGLKASMDDNYGFAKCPNLTYDSCMNILNGLYDFTANNEEPKYGQGVLRVHPNFVNTVGSWNMMLAEEKGWTIITE